MAAPAAPLVSVVIPCYNYGAYVEDAVRSCLRSTWQDLEILVIDDGSTDPETQRVLDGLNYPKTRVIHQENRGLPAARNRGIREAVGRYVLPLDADDTIHPTLIEKALLLLEANPGLGFASFWLRHFGDEDWVWMPPPFNFGTLLDDNIVTVASLFPKAAWEEVGGYNEAMRQGYEDWDFWITLAKRGWIGRQIPEPLFNYRRHGHTMVHEAHKKRDALVAKLRANHPGLYGASPLVSLRRRWQPRLLKAKRQLSTLAPWRRHPLGGMSSSPVEPLPAIRSLVVVNPSLAELESWKAQGAARQLTVVMTEPQPLEILEALEAATTDHFVLPHYLSPADFVPAIVQLASRRHAEAILLAEGPLQEALKRYGGGEVRLVVGTALTEFVATFQEASHG